MRHHGASLARLTAKTKPADFVRKLVEDPATAPLSERERALVDYAAKLTRTPSAMAEVDLAAMRAAGLDDRDILDANLTVAYFAFVNRIADGLGVPLEEVMNEQDRM